jgi:hypothetical protein
MRCRRYQRASETRPDGPEEGEGEIRSPPAGAPVIISFWSGRICFGLRSFLSRDNVFVCVASARLEVIEDFEFLVRNRPEFLEAAWRKKKRDGSEAKEEKK